MMTEDEVKAVHDALKDDGFVVVTIDDQGNVRKVENGKGEEERDRES